MRLDRSSMKVLMLMLFIDAESLLRYKNDEIGRHELLKCATYGKFHVHEMPPETQQSANEEHDYLLHNECLRNVGHDKMSETSPIQDTYYCPELHIKWRENGELQTINREKSPRVQYILDDSNCMSAAGLNASSNRLYTFEKAFKDKKFNGISECISPNSRTVMIGDSIMRQLFIPFDCRLHAIGVVKKREVLGTYVFQASWMKKQGTRETHTKLTLFNNATIEFFFSTVPGGHWGLTSNDSARDLLNRLPSLLEADVVVVSLSPAHYIGEYPSMLRDNILTFSRNIWKLKEDAQLYLQSRAPLGDEKNFYPWNPLYYESEEDHAAELQSCKTANADLIDLQTLFNKRSDLIVWPNGTMGPLQHIFYCDQQHQSIVSGFPDTEADLLWSYICDASSRKRKQMMRKGRK